MIPASFIKWRDSQLWLNANMTTCGKKLKFNISENTLISNVTANEMKNPEEIKKLLIKQIESRVRWRESIIYMIKKRKKQLFIYV